MPKQNYEIKAFNRGIISNPDDALDIPENAATYSLNIDPLTEGSLGAIPVDAALKESGFTSDRSLITYTQGAGSPPTSGGAGTQGQFDPPVGE